MTYHPPIVIAETGFGEKLRLSVSRGRGGPASRDEAGFLVTYEEFIDGHYPLAEMHEERFRSIDDALMAYASRRTMGEPWKLYQSHIGNVILDRGDSLSVPADALRSLLDEVSSRVSMKDLPEAYYAGMFASELAARKMSSADVEFLGRLGSEIIVRDTSDIDPLNFMQMSIVNNPVAPETVDGRPGKTIRVRNLTAAPRSGGGFRIEGESGVEYFHDIHLATLAFEQRMGEIPERVSGFGMEDEQDGGRNEPKDRLLGELCASMPEMALGELLAFARRIGADYRIPEEIEQLEELRAVTYGVGELVTSSIAS